MRRFLIVIVMAMAMLVTACAGESQAPAGLPKAKEGTLLRKIQDRGMLIVGTRTDSPTFCYQNPQTKQLEGFDIAMAREIAAYIFGDPNKVEFKTLTSAERIPMVKSGAVDLVIATMTITEERLKEVDFSVVYYVAGQRLLVPQASSIKGLTDVDGKKVGTVKGSTSAANLRKATKAQVVEFDSWTDAVKAMLNQQVDAISTDDTILYGLQTANPGTKVVGSQFSYEPYGMAMLKNEPDFANAVNTVIKNLKSSGKWKTIWQAEVGNKVGITVAPEPPGDEWKK
jgi:putative glutamine transport system substrate-binding protein